jgi:dTDP-4-dehydrorhamnose 3,5-epimerase
MNEIKSEIDGVIIRQLEKHSDYRGWLIELFRQDELPGDFKPVMGYISMTKSGEIRGPHEHKEQTDCFCVLGPSTFVIYFWDNREESKTFRTKFKIEAGEENIFMIIVPPGVVHAYKNIGKEKGFVVNVPDKLYAGEGKKSPPDEIRYEDQKDSQFNLF